MFIRGAVIFIKKAATFIGKGNLAIRKLFKIAIIFIGRGGSAIKKRGEANKTYTDGAYTGKAFTDGDYTNRARVNKIFNS